MEDDLLSRARDAGYTALGFGVLAVQRLQVRRRELAKDMAGAAGPTVTAARPAVGGLLRRVEKAVDPVLDGVERRLPGQARSAFRTARAVGKTLQRTLLD